MWKNLANLLLAVARKDNVYCWRYPFLMLKTIIKKASKKLGACIYSSFINFLPVHVLYLVNKSIQIYPVAY